MPRERFTLVSFGQLGSHPLTEGLPYVIYVLDVDGATVLIIAGEGPGELAIDEIADSIAWKDSG